MRGAALIVALAGAFAGVLSVVLALVAAARKAAGRAAEARRRRLDATIRPLLAEALADGEAGPEFVAARGRRGRAVDRLAMEYAPKVRGDASRALARLLESRDVAPRLRVSVRRGGRVARAKAAARLGDVGSPAALRALTEVLDRDRRAEVRSAGARALGKLGMPEAVTSLLDALERRRVPEGVAAAALLEVGPAGIDRLRAAVVSAQPATRALVAEILGALQAAGAVPELIAALADPEPEVRIAAARALGAVGSPAAVGPLIECVRPDHPPALRAVAAAALGRLDAVEAVEDLAPLIATPDYWVAHNAATALSELGPQGRGVLEGSVANAEPGAAHAREALALAALRGLTDSSYLRWRANPSAATRFDDAVL